MTKIQGAAGVMCPEAIKRLRPDALARPMEWPALALVRSLVRFFR
jgi:hypothetical protein